MRQALQWLDADDNTSVVAVSSLYRTPPWGRTDQPHFLNAAAELHTSHAPRALLDLCLATEQRLHRVRAERWGPRVIDLDILLFGDRVVHEEGLQIPHPRLLQRAFVLVPLLEIAGSLALDGLSLSQALAQIDREGIVAMPSGANWWKDDVG